MKTVVKIDGNPEQRYFTLTERHLRLLGLVPREGAKHELVLVPGADPEAVLVFPGGLLTFTAKELTELANKSRNARGWQVDAYDPCGYPTEPAAESEETA